MTLVEVLVALVIFALGMLGAGGLIMSSLRSGQYSGYASVAIGLARDYGEMMQLIPATVESTAVTGNNNAFFVDSESTLTAPTTCRGSGATCDADAMILFSRYDWVQRVKAAFPGGRAVVCKDKTPKDANGLYTWDCDNTGTLIVVKFGWLAKTGPAGTGDDFIDEVRPKMVVTLFGNQTDFVSP
ncbi:MAG: type IV pilus modification protein PilV [Rhodoferax sp.]|nr:type IV pilus modification protein PilV [Rhodoferax sp.]